MACQRPGDQARAVAEPKVRVLRRGERGGGGAIESAARLLGRVTGDAFAHYGRAGEMRHASPTGDAPAPGARHAVVTPGQAFGQDSEVIEQMNPQPAGDDRHGMAAAKLARRGDQRRVLDAHGRTRPLEPADKVIVFHKRVRANPTERFIDRAAHEDSRISVVETAPPDPRVEAGQPTAERVAAVEDNSPLIKSAPSDSLVP